MSEYLQLILLTLAGGVFSLAGGIILIRKHSLADKMALYATPFAAGALLAAVFLDLLKDGLEQADSDTVLLAALIGILLFFIAERFLHWFHHHHQHEHEDEADVTKPLIIIGDTIHNALDGVAIAASFLLSPATGVITTIAVAAHEIPQEIGDFGLLLSKGMSRRKVIIVNIASALATTAAAVITFSLGSAEVLPLGVLFGVSAGFLLYIAMSDVIPDIHENSPRHKLFDWRPMLLILGVVIVGVAIHIAHRYIDTGHPHSDDMYYMQDDIHYHFDDVSDTDHSEEHTY